MRSIEKIEIVSDNYKLVSQHRIGGLQVDGYFQGASAARYDLQPPVIVLAILGFTNLTIIHRSGTILIHEFTFIYTDVTACHKSLHHMMRCRDLLSFDLSVPTELISKFSHYFLTNFHLGRLRRMQRGIVFQCRIL